MVRRRVQPGLRSFIIRHQWGDELSDFVRIATGDFDLPNAKSWDQLESYIKGRYPNAAPSTLNSAKSIWQHYVGSVDGKRAGNV